MAAPDRTPAPADRSRPVGRLATGWAELDEILGGGWPVGRLVEIRGRGRTSLALGAVRAAQESVRGGSRRSRSASADLPVAWVDGSGTFCPATARGVDLARLTLVHAEARDAEASTPTRSRSRGGRGATGQALFAADILLRSRAYALLVLDLPACGAPLSAWFRLARLASRARTWLLVLHGGARPVTGSAASLVLDVQLQPVVGPPWGELPPPALEVRLRRHRRARRRESGGSRVVLSASG